MGRESKERAKNRMAGGVATAAYLAVWLVLIFFVTCSVKPAEDDSEGFMINFGNSETGSGPRDLRTSVETPPAQSRPRPAAPRETVATQEREPAPQIPPAERPAPVDDDTPSPTDTPHNTVPAQPAEQPRQVDQRALFPGASNSDATSEGASSGPGNQGNPAGSNEGSHQGTGTGTSGDRWNLSGRSLIGALPPPRYNVREEGTVIIEITVDQRGTVVGEPVFILRGSTTNNAALVDAAKEAAKKALFNVKEGSPLQVGTITYHFRIN